MDRIRVGKKASKKTKIVGRKNYIDPDTGELIEMHVMDVEERDANFHKVWLIDIISKLDIVTNKKTRVVFYIMDNLNSENLLIKRQKDIEKELGVSEKTVNETFRILIEGDFMTMIQNGVYRINPEVIFKGKHNHRMNVLVRYRDEKAKTEESDKALAEEERMLREKLAQIQRQIAKLEELKAACPSNQQPSDTPDKPTSMVS